MINALDLPYNSDNIIKMLLAAHGYGKRCEAVAVIYGTGVYGMDLDMHIHKRAGNIQHDTVPVDRINVKR